MLLIAICGIALVMFNTRWGAYLSDDTYYYIYPVQELLAGRGFNPSYFFGPLFPLVLAGLSLTGINVLVAARGLNALLFGVNIFLAGTIARRLDISAGFAWLAAALILLSDVIVEAHGWAMSEALGFTFILLSLLLALEYFKTNRKRYWWGLVIAAGLALLTRYASLPLVGAIALTLLLFPPGKPFIRRLANAFLFGVLSLTPLLIYFARNQAASGHPFRYLNFFSVPFTQDQLTWLIYNWFSLFFPGRFLRGREIEAGLVLIAAGGLLASGIYVLLRKKRLALDGQGARIGLFMLASLIILNFAMLYVARGFTELDIYNTRYLVPILIVFLIFGIGAAGLLWKSGGRFMRAVISVLCGLFVIYYGIRTVDFSQQVSTTGLGYANVGWHNSETTAYIQAHPELNDMVSTGEMGIYFWTNRKPKSLAEFSNPQELKKYLCQSHASLFVMDQMPTEIYGMAHDEVVEVLSLTMEFNDGQMYQCPSGGGL